MPWCPCATGISQHEIATEGYQELTHRTMTLRFPLLGRVQGIHAGMDHHPLDADQQRGCAVGPERTYAKVKQEDEVLYLSKETLSMLHGPYEVLAELKGSGWKAGLIPVRSTTWNRPTSGRLHLPRAADPRRQAKCRPGPPRHPVGCGG